MGLWDKLRQASEYLRELRLSRDPDSYSQYKRGRDSERREADQYADRGREKEEQGREKAARERGYEERYTHERDDDS